MKYSTKLSDTIHILIFIALGDDEQPSSTKIAESIKTNPAYVRQLMATLKNAGIVVNTHKVMRMPLLQNRQIKSICMTSTEL